MTLILASTSHNAPEMPAIPFLLFVLIVTAGYGLACWLKPFTQCHRCRGVGASPRRLSDRWRYRYKARPRAARGLPTCPRCRGTGLRLRTGRRVFNHFYRLHHRSH